MAQHAAHAGKTHSQKAAQGALSAAAAISFLKETRGLLTWTIKDLQKSLLIGAAQAREVVAALELQGYVKQAENPNEWLTTLHGEAVSGSKAPRFSREAVEKSLAALRERIKFINKDPRSPYKIAQAVAFGDFLHGSAQAQAADVGILLESRDSSAEHPDNSKLDDAVKGIREKDRAAFLKHLRARDLKVSLLPYEPWMSERSHLNLLDSPIAKPRR